MYFKDIVGHDDIKQRLISEVKEGRIAHAQLFCGEEGSGALPLAIAFAQYVLCTNKGAEEACGQCPSCVKLQKLVHPDLHFSFPIAKPSKIKTDGAISEVFLKEWRMMFAQGPYFSNTAWMEAMNADNQQPTIYTADATNLINKLSLKSSEGGYKVAIIWRPELMNVAGLNSLLKLIEEPPAQTLFILVSQKPDMLLPTILSRTQRVDFRRIPNEIIRQALYERNGIEDEMAAKLVQSSAGNYLRVLETIHVNENSQLFFDMFCLLMRLSYQRNLKELKNWSAKVSGWGREMQKNFLYYCQYFVRENFVFNFQKAELNYMTMSEQQFATRFARFINERNVIGIMEELDVAQRDIERNVNSKMVFFDLTMKIIVLLIK